MGERVNTYVFEETRPEQFVHGDEKESAFPEVLEPGKVYVCKEYFCTVHLCPCGCGDKVFLGISEMVASHPHLWQLEGNSFSPSIRKTSGCMSHYFIKNGKVQWA